MEHRFRHDFFFVLLQFQDYFVLVGFACLTFPVLSEDVALFQSDKKDDLKEKNKLNCNIL